MPMNSLLKCRQAGMLLHITSLPGRASTGTLGSDALKFVDLLAETGFTVWQTLPINPTHADGSPYQCSSVHAGDPRLIDINWLKDKALIDHLPVSSQWTAEEQRLCLAQAGIAFQQLEINNPLRVKCQLFREQHAYWLDDYCLFVALKEWHQGRSWQTWPAGLRDRNPEAIKAITPQIIATINRIAFEQFVFFEQWSELRVTANKHGILLFGDMPIFVADDSADVWANREWFDLDKQGYPRVVAGVPPDYFSATGQRWGNPHYAWDKMQASGFSWWIKRMQTQLALYDWVRIDHFRGFESYWEIPASAPTAIEGHWVKAPGMQLLSTLQTFLSQDQPLPLVAEDLGIITDEVDAIRQAFNIPGMRVLQFAFEGGPANPYLPHQYELNTVAYTGTHDNNTTLGWFNELSSEIQQHIYDYLGESRLPMPQALIQSALSSAARLTIIPLQDMLCLPGSARMNTPGTVGPENWSWRFTWDQLHTSCQNQVTHWIYQYGRRMNNQ